ncbi:hypothetical protein VA249_45670 (plasmid) [Vibrio alfacsensis]|uniref:TraA family conjugative transfer protein n=1 Tax=Vibrio alfacsensis TaxID=1074311 RepID=UPI001BF05472|nr:TraA family conjugative transfer protein [Vibrio alfacsensis]BBM67921.1 hypothetical protein VA249_45670 [Vibrio alfacsensis]
MITANNVNFTASENALMKTKFFLSLIVLACIMSALATAGSDATFDTWVDQMTNWLEGSLGKGVSIAFVIVGIVMGVMRQSLMAFAVGVGAALGMNYTPDVISGMFSAVL